MSFVYLHVSLSLSLIKISLLIGFSCRYDERKLDLIVLVDQATDNLVYIERLKTQLLYLVNLISEKDYVFRLALAGYQNHKEPQTSVLAPTQNFTSDVEKMKLQVANLKCYGQEMASMKGLADGLAWVWRLAETDSDGDYESKFRKDATKLCILLRKYSK